MSFADFAGGNHTAPTGGYNRNATAAAAMHVGGGNTDISSGLTSKARQAIDAATLKLEQFNRQVLVIKRAANSLGSVANNKSRSSNGATNALDDDMHDRIRFACLLQEELAKALQLLPHDSTTALLKKKLCKDFEAISHQLEAAVVRISTHEQAVQSALVAQSQDAAAAAASNDGRLVATHQGQVIEFQELQDLEHEIAHNEALIDERARDIDSIHDSVAQVHEIFRDLAAIVHEQQGVIDDIETNVHDTLDQTQRGRDEVQKAADMQSRCVLQ